MINNFLYNIFLSRSLFLSIFGTFFIVGIIYGACGAISFVFFGPFTEPKLLISLALIISVIAGLIEGLDFIHFHRNGYLSKILSGVKYEAFAFYTLFVPVVMFLMNSVLHGYQLVSSTFNYNGLGLLNAIGITAFIITMINERIEDDAKKRSRQHDLRLAFPFQILLAGIWATVIVLLVLVVFTIAVGILKAIAVFDTQGFFYILVVTIIFQIFAVVRTKESKTHFID